MLTTPTESTLDLAAIQRLQALGYGYQHGSDTLVYGRSAAPWQVLEILGRFEEVPRICMNDRNCSPVIPAEAGIHPVGLAVIPAEAGIHPDSAQCKLPRWIPASAGMTGEQFRMIP